MAHLHRGRTRIPAVEWSGKVDIVVRIRDVVAALDAVGAFRPRLMLMDIEMPSMGRHESRVD